MTLIGVGCVGDHATMDPVLDFSDDSQLPIILRGYLANLEDIIGTDSDAGVLALAPVKIDHRDDDAGAVSGKAFVFGHGDHRTATVWRRSAVAKSFSVVVGLPSSFHVSPE